MTPKDAARTIISLVPLWYTAACGPNKYELSIAGERFPFHSANSLTGYLWEFKGRAEQIATQLIKESECFPVPSYTDLLAEMLVLEWLHMRIPTVAWRDVVSYTTALADRTYENAPVTVNVIIRATTEGKFSLYEDKYGKFTDHLASGLFTYFLADSQLRVVDYCEITWDQITTDDFAKCTPEFLQPFQCVMEDDDVSFHLTHQRDLIIAGKRSLLAARRKRKWKLYEHATLRAAVAHALGDPSVAPTIYEVLFDLSFRRHGALLVYDPRDAVIAKVVNPESRLDNSAPTAGRELIAAAASRINTAYGTMRPVTNKRLLLELAGIDGAVIFNKKQITAVGAIVKTHEEAKGIAGARSTAALSAYFYGGHPVKISSDGEVSILFNSYEEAHGSRFQGCQAQLEWL